MLKAVQTAIHGWFTTGSFTGTVSDGAGDRTEYDRLAIPHTFKPQLSVLGAMIAISEALARIFLGSLLFAVCGTYIWMAIDSIANPVLQVLAFIPMAIVAVLVFALLMIAISRVARAVSPKNIAPSATPIA